MEDTEPTAQALADPFQQNSRRRQGGAGIDKLAGPSILPSHLVDDDDVLPNLSVCAAGQIASGALFAFMFGGVGFVLAGGSGTRSILWFIGMTLGAFLGVTAAKGSTATGVLHSSGITRLQLLVKLPTDAVAGLVTAAGCILFGGFYAAVLPSLPSDHVIASIVTGFGGWFIHPLVDVAMEAHLHGWKSIGFHTFVDATMCGIRTNTGNWRNTVLHAPIELPAVPKAPALADTYSGSAPSEIALASAGLDAGAATEPGETTMQEP